MRLPFTSKLDSVAKRAAYLAMLFGLLVTAIGLVPILDDCYSLGDAVNRWGMSVFRDDAYWARKYWVAVWGTYLVAAAGCVAYLDRWTVRPAVHLIRKMARWVQSGNP